MALDLYSLKPVSVDVPAGFPTSQAQASKGSWQVRKDPQVPFRQL